MRTSSDEAKREHPPFLPHLVPLMARISGIAQNPTDLRMVLSLPGGPWFVPTVKAF